MTIGVGSRLAEMERNFDTFGEFSGIIEVFEIASSSHLRSQLRHKFTRKFDGRRNLTQR